MPECKCTPNAKCANCGPRAQTEAERVIQQNLAIARAHLPKDNGNGNDQGGGR